MFFHTVKQLVDDDTGFIISAELVIVLTIAVLAMLVGLHEVAVAINTELNDLSNAFGAMSQTYAYTGFTGSNGVQSGLQAKAKSTVNGSAFNDAVDDCDLNVSCDLVLGVTAGSALGGELSIR